MKARILDLTPEEYDAERGAHLTQTLATIMLNRSPRHAQLAMERRGEKKRTDEMVFGSIVHELILGRGKGFAVAEYDPEAAATATDDETEEKPKRKGKPFVPRVGASGRPEFENWISGPAKAIKAQIEARGLVPILPKTYRIAEWLARQARETLSLDHEIELGGCRSEVAVEWEEQATNGGPVTCRGQLDLWDARRARVYDLKIVHSAHPRVLDRRLLAHGDDLQATAYVRAMESVYPDLAGRIEFCFLFVEVGTGIVTPLVFDGTMRRVGELRWRRAVDLWEQCKRVGYWPGYVTRPHVAHAPEWALAEEEAAITEAGFDATRGASAPADSGDKEEDDYPF